MLLRRATLLKACSRTLIQPHSVEIPNKVKKLARMLSKCIGPVFAHLNLKKQSAPCTRHPCTHNKYPPAPTVVITSGVDGIATHPTATRQRQDTSQCVNCVLRECRGVCCAASLNGPSRKTGCLVGIKNLDDAGPRKYPLQTHFYAGLLVDDRWVTASCKLPSKQLDTDDSKDSPNQPTECQYVDDVRNRTQKSQHRHLDNQSRKHRCSLREHSTAEKRVGVLDWMSENDKTHHRGSDRMKKQTSTHRTETRAQDSFLPEPAGSA